MSSPPKIISIPINKMKSHRLESSISQIHGPPKTNLPLLQYQRTTPKVEVPYTHEIKSSKSKSHRLESSIPKQARKLRKPFNGFVYYRFYIQFSDEHVPFEDHFRYEGDKRNVMEAIRNHMETHNYKSLIEQHRTDYSTIEITYVDFGQPPPLDYKKIKMNQTDHFNLHVNLFDNLIELKTTDDNCVPETLKKLYGKKITSKKLDIYANMKNANTEEVMEFCKKYGIRAIAYNINKEVIAENIPEHDTQKYKTLVYLSYMNHMYLIKNKYLIEKPEKYKEQIKLQSGDLQQQFKQLLDDKTLPSNIKLYQGIPTSFIHEEMLYFSNDDYDKCKTIAKKFMFSDKISPLTNLTSILRDLEPLYTSTFANSFLPIRHTKPAFYYNKSKDPKREVQQIDKNKAYSNILRDLPYLLSTDLRTYECLKINNFIGEHALYIVEPKFPNILIPKEDIYSGQHIKYCLGKFDFTIKEVLKCKTYENHFSKLITELFNIEDPDTAKKIIVKAIGLFQIEPTTESIPEIKIVSEEERDPNYNSYPYENVYFQEIPKIKAKNIYNRKPIAIQIKDKMNQMLFEKMQELKLTDDDIVQINTDSITFYSKPNLNLKLDKNDMNGWKAGIYKESNGSIYESKSEKITFFQTIENDNTLITGPAGNGKSYYIQHMDLTDAIILSSKHSAIRQHREKGLNAEVIQKFSGFSDVTLNKIPVENHIIVEECGILTRQNWDFLFKCVLLNKKLTILGDFNQLLPVDEIHTFNQPAFINMIFKNQSEMNKNWRNSFTQDYYDSLINSTDKEYLKQEILKYSTQTPKDANVIIAYRNVIVDKYNNYMLNYHNKKITDPDVPVMCITNDLRNKDMFNNFLFNSQEIDNKLLTNEKYFRPAYARTLYNMQGDECKLYYIAPEDIDWFLNPRMAYTLISRIKNL